VLAQINAAITTISAVPQIIAVAVTIAVGKLILSASPFAEPTKVVYSKAF
jgi:hypothetical protein